MAPKPKIKAPPSQTKQTPLGASPSSLAKRRDDSKDKWCPKVDIEFDPYCDPHNPVACKYQSSIKAVEGIRDYIPKTPLRKSRECKDFNVELYYKFETFHKTGSFNERGALNVLLSLNATQQEAGVVCASTGNFGMALAYYGKKLSVRTRVVFPEHTSLYYVNKCKDFGAKVTLDGETLTDARHKAFTLANDFEMIFINGYDHPAVIAGAGTIALEILEDLPEVDTILVPVGGGGLIAGIAEVVRKMKNDTKVYGVEPDKCCCFFKAMEKEGIFETEVRRGIAESLGVPTAGCNSFHTAKSLISKMILVDDDWIARAVAHLADVEKIVVEGAGATSLSPMFGIPHILEELNGKIVVCVITGSNMSNIAMLPRCLDRARAIEGTLIKLTMHIDADDIHQHLHVMSMIANTGCNVIQNYVEHAWISDNDLHRIRLHLVIETRNLEHACQLKRVMNKLFPNQCDFMEEPFSPIPVCVCYPRKKPPFVAEIKV